MPASLSVAALLAVALSLGIVHAAVKPPPYLKTCSRNDPKLNECALKRGREMIPSLIPGDKSIRLPPLDPLILEKLEVRPTGNSQSAGLTLVCFKCNTRGLSQTKLEAINIDLKKKHMDLDLSIPSIIITGKYEVSGNVLVLPINGKGDANVTLTEVNAKVNLDWELKSKKGVEYAQFTNQKVNFTTKLLQLHFSNLFNGDKVLGDNMNTFLNENWEAVLKDFNPAVSETIGQTAKLILNNIFDVLPYSMLFPEK